MSPRTAPLRTTGALAVTGLLAAGSLAVGVPAHAADPVFTLGGPAETAVRPYPATGSPLPSSLGITVHHPDTGEEGTGYEGEVTYTLDLGGIEGVAVLSPAGDSGADCETDGATAVCHRHGVRPGLGGVADFALTAAEGSADGATGTIEVTGSADGAVFAPFTTRVTVGGPDLVMKRLPFERRLRPGDVQPAPITFSNRGPRAAGGVLLTLRYSRGLEIPERYGNCVYGTEAGEEPFDAFAWSTALCSVEGSFEPGATYTLGVPLSVKAGPHAYDDTFVYGVAEDGPAPTAQRAGAAFRRGAGPELTLRKATAVATRGADLDPSDNQREADFRTENTADFVALGGTGTGAVGERVTARIGYRNDGPAWIGHLRSGESVAALDFTVPEGAEVTAKPPSCRGVTATGGHREEQLGAPRYVCDSSMTVRDGAQAALPFELKITEAVPDAVGTVRVRGPRLSAPGLPFDPEPANNTALWVLNGDGGPGTGDTGGTKGSTGGGSNGSNDGSAGGSTGHGTGGSTGQEAGGSTGAGTAGSASGTTGGASSSVTAGTSGAGSSGTGGALASTGTVVPTLSGGAAAVLVAGGVLYVTARRRASHR